MHPPAQATTALRSTGAPLSGAAIVDVRAWATSFPVPAAHSVRLGVGRALKRDAVFIRVTTEDGLVGWGESHHGQAHSTVAHFATHALKPMVLGMDASNVTASGSGSIPGNSPAAASAGCALAMSGLDDTHPAIEGPTYA